MDGPALHGLHEDALHGGDVSHKMSAELSSVTVRILNFRFGKHLTTPEDFCLIEGFHFS